MKLLLDTGLTFEGKSFGFKKNVEGEVVFNTAMTGYVETLTDPSYRGQILTNFGFNLPSTGQLRYSHWTL